MGWIIDQWELEYVYPPSHNKFYRIYLFGNGETFVDSTELRVVTQWGRIGTEGQHRVQIFNDYWSAINLVDNTRNSKSAKGYVYTINRESVDPYRDVLMLAGITDAVMPVQSEQPVTVEAVEREITDLLVEIGELNSGKKSVSKRKHEDLMDRYSELVQKAEEVTQETSEAAERTKQAISMAFSGVVNLGVK
jgi:predicted DNA-binding WGR domain protein/ElaB/YqjD/DUF883 family membrane-anchored ribosome-binding protein